MLVVDVVKGVQTQTAECLLIGELTCPRMVVVLNKIDLLPPNKRQSAIEKMTKRLHKTLESTRSAFNTSKRNNLDACRGSGCELWTQTAKWVRASRVLWVMIESLVKLPHSLHTLPPCLHSSGLSVKPACFLFEITLIITSTSKHEVTPV